MPYQNHPKRPLTPESAIDKWAEKPTLKQTAVFGFCFFLLILVAQFVWYATGA
jgi:hypothetical protein